MPTTKTVVHQHNSGKQMKRYSAKKILYSSHKHIIPYCNHRKCWISFLSMKARTMTVMILSAVLSFTVINVRFKLKWKTKPKNKTENSDEYFVWIAFVYLFLKMENWRCTYAKFWACANVKKNHSLFFRSIHMNILCFTFWNFKKKTTKCIHLMSVVLLSLLFICDMVTMTGEVMGVKIKCENVWFPFYSLFSFFLSYLKAQNNIAYW